MSHSLSVVYVELRVPDAETEQEFLLLAVQTAVKKFGETQGRLARPAQNLSSDTIALPQEVGS